MAETEELKSLLMKVKEESEKVGFLQKKKKTQPSKNKDPSIQSHHFMANRWGKSGNSGRLFLWAPKSLLTVTVGMKLKDICSLDEKL